MHGTIEAKGYHNHHNRSYKIHITTTGKTVTWNRQHIKPTTISAEHYLQDQLCKHTKSDPLGNILAQQEKQQYAYNITNNTYNGQNVSNTNHSHTMACEAQDNHQNGEKKIVKKKTM